MALKLTFEIEYNFNDTFNDYSFRIDYFINHEYIYFGYSIHKNILHGWYYKYSNGFNNKVKKYMKLSKD